jgi:hypothetical protein
MGNHLNPDDVLLPLPRDDALGLATAIVIGIPIALLLWAAILLPVLWALGVL